MTDKVPTRFDPHFLAISFPVPYHLLPTRDVAVLRLFLQIECLFVYVWICIFRIASLSRDMLLVCRNGVENELVE